MRMVDSAVFIRQWMNILFSAAIPVLCGAGTISAEKGVERFANNAIHQSVTPVYSVWKEFPAPDWFVDICYGDGRFLAYGEKDGFFNSPDAVNWTKANITVKPPSCHLSFEHGLFRCFSLIANQKSELFNKDSLCIITSRDGTTWKSGTTLAVVGNKFTDATFGNGTWLCVGELGTMVHSSDGNSWTIEKRITHNNLTGAAYGTGLFIVTGGHGEIFVSRDAHHWTNRAISSADWLGKVMFDEGRFVIIPFGYSGGFEQPTKGNILTSTDGIAWIVDSCNMKAAFRAITFGAGKYAAVCGNKILISEIKTPDPAKQSIEKKTGDSHILGIVGKSDYSLFNVVKLSPEGKLSLSAPVTSVNADRFSYPELKVNGTRISDFIPEGWEITDSVQGDLNKDNRDDAVLIFRLRKAIISSGIYPNRLMWCKPRMVAVVFKDAANRSYNLIARDTSLFPKGLYEDNYERCTKNMFINKCTLMMDFEYIIPSKSDESEVVSAEYKFRFQNSRIMLIGAELSDCIDDGKGTCTTHSINMITRKLISTNKSNHQKRETFEPSDESPALGKPVSWLWDKFVPYPLIAPFDEFSMLDLGQE